MSLLRRERRQWAPEPVVPPFPGAFPGGGAAPTLDGALRVSSVWACVRLLADSVAMMPVEAYTLRAGVRVPTPAPPLLVRPSADAVMADWVYMVMVSLLLRGNAYGQIVRRDSLGYPVQIELVNPDMVSCHTDEFGVLTYRFGTAVVDPRDVVHVRAYRMPGSRVGLSPIAYAARAISTEHAVSRFALDFFADGAHPSSILSSDATFTQEQSKTIKERFVAAVNGREPAVLSGGLKYEQIQVNPNESQFLETQKYGVAQIARIFGVPPEMIAGEAGNSMTYANVEQRSIDFLTYSVQPWLTKLEAAFAQLLPGQRHVRFDTSVLTRTDFETTMRATSIGIASKQMTPDEAREHRDEPPLTEKQKQDLAEIPLTVTPSGKVTSAPPKAEGEPA